MHYGFLGVVSILISVVSIPMTAVASSSAGRMTVSADMLSPDRD